MEQETLRERLKSKPAPERLAAEAGRTRRCWPLYWKWQNLSAPPCATAPPRRCVF